MHRFRLGWCAEEREDQRQVDPSKEDSTCFKFCEQDTGRGGPELEQRRNLGAAVKARQEVLVVMSLWNDVGETTWEHVMGDASAASGIIRRMGLGKVRHLNTSWLRVRRKGSATRNAVPHSQRQSQQR